MNLHEQLLVKIVDYIHQHTGALRVGYRINGKRGDIRVDSLDLTAWDSCVLLNRGIQRRYVIYDLDDDRSCTWKIHQHRANFSPFKALEFSREDLDNLALEETFRILRDLGIAPTVLSLLVSPEISHEIAT